VPQVVQAQRLRQQLGAADRVELGEDSIRSVVEVVAEELGPSLRWTTATMTRATRSQDR
jgi:hypothetical protein